MTWSSIRENHHHHGCCHHPTPDEFVASSGVGWGNTTVSTTGSTTNTTRTITITTTCTILMNQKNTLTDPIPVEKCPLVQEAFQFRCGGGGCCCGW